MTISRKLYIGFGSILGILVLLSLVSFTTSQREHSARNTGASSLQSIQIIEKIRYQVMDDAERGIQKALEESNASANSSATYRTMALTVGTIIGVFLGMIVAYRTSLSITQPLAALIGITREIAETGDLDQKIEIHRDDEIGSLADHYRNMMLHLKEMASVSSAIAEGRLNVTVRPRSSRDTMANAFLQMIRGLRDLAMKVRDSATGVASGSSQMAAASTESAKVSVEAAPAIDEDTSPLHEKSITVQNAAEETQIQP